MAATRREFLQGVVAGSAALGVGWTQRHPLAAAERGAITEARRQAARRGRRIIYNNDGDDILAKGAVTPEQFLALRHTPFLNTQVDSIYYNTTQSFNLFVHKTSVAEMFLTDRPPVPANNLSTLLQQQTDGLRMSCEFSRKHGIESIWTLRMNDIHDVAAPVFVSQWKKDNPRRVMSTMAEVDNLRDRRRLWSLVDFENPEVEPRIVAIVEEVLQNYPVDGIDLDFLRAPFYFRSTYEGQPATDKQMGLLTRLVEQIRKLVTVESERQGKPFILTCRVPVTESFCRYIGIDIRNWLQAGLIDTLSIGGGYVAFDQPVAEMIQLGHSYQVPVYPCLSLSGLSFPAPRGKGEPQSAAAWKGAATRLWDTGADGIQTFNLFSGPGTAIDMDTVLSILNSIGAKETLVNSDRIFAVCDAGSYMPWHYWAKDVEEFSGALPVALNAKDTTSVSLVVTDPLASQGTTVTTELRLDFTDLGDADGPAVLWNSQPLGPPTAAETVAKVRRIRFAVPPEAVRAGSNEIRLAAHSEKVKLVGAELWVTRNA